MKHVANANVSGAVAHATPIFVIAVALNYAWELAQAPLYVGMTDWRSMGWHCFVASLGDGLLVCLIYAVGCIAYRSVRWYIAPQVHAIGLMLAMGLFMSIAIEWVALNIIHRWEYLAGMPRLPGDIGLTPVLQMLVLPPLIFHLAARRVRRS